MHHNRKNERQYKQLHKHSCLDFSKFSPLRIYPLAQNNEDIFFFLWVDGIATHYGLDGPGNEYRRGRDFPRQTGAALGLP
jgi:hypothetical protein